MDLFETDGNAIPPNAIVVPVRTRDGLTLRVARWTPRLGRDAEVRGTVTLAMGRSEFIEEYTEIVAALLERGFAVVAMDWRGQGMSDRETRWRRRGYVAHFPAYRLDLEALEQQVLKPFAPRPWFALGHSMGAAILIDQAHDGESPFERLILSAPMIGLSLRRPVMVRRATRLATRLGFGARLIPGGSEDSPFLSRGFAGNILTGDPRQYERLRVMTTRLSRLAIGAPTLSWVAGAFDLMEKFKAPLYPVETLTPILILAAGVDHIVDTAATERFAIRLKAGRCITIPGALHQVMMERPEVTRQFWAAFDAFIPGERVEATAAPEAPARGPGRRAAPTPAAP